MNITVGDLFLLVQLIVLLRPFSSFVVTMVVPRSITRYGDSQVYLFNTRFKSASLTDKRINIMNEVITGIKVIKMYTWEYAFKSIVSILRK